MKSQCLSLSKWGREHWNWNWLIIQNKVNLSPFLETLNISKSFIQPNSLWWGSNGWVLLFSSELGMSHFPALDKTNIERIVKIGGKQLLLMFSGYREAGEVWMDALDWQVGHDSCSGLQLTMDIIWLVWAGPSPSLALLRLNRAGWLSHSIVLVPCNMIDFRITWKAWRSCTALLQSTSWMPSLTPLHQGYSVFLASFVSFLYSLSSFSAAHRDSNSALPVSQVPLS